jgi:cytochrome c peroxidase
MKKRITITMMITIPAFVFIFSTAIQTKPVNKATLGELLFSDPILSKDNTISCASCHKPAYAFADTSAVSGGVAGKKGARNTPTAMNLSLSRSFFWDGRSKTLEEQALGPIENLVEMNLPVDEAIYRLKNNKKYTEYFKEIFNSEPTKENLGAAIAAFERTLETSNSPFDNWKFSDDSTAVSNAVKRGFIVFNGKGKCIKCHFGADLTAQEFRNIGLFNGKNLNDSGRSVVSGKAEDIGKFKTSSLRNIAITAPYMHNGLFKTLEQVIDFYNDTKKIVPNAINKDTLLNKPLGLTRQEKKDLETFLISLTDKRFNKLKK